MNKLFLECFDAGLVKIRNDRRSTTQKQVQVQVQVQVQEQNQEQKTKCYCDMEKNEFTFLIDEEEVIDFIDLTKFLPEPSIYNYVKLEKNLNGEERYVGYFSFYSESCERCLAKKDTKCNQEFKPPVNIRSRTTKDTKCYCDFHDKSHTTISEIIAFPRISNLPPPEMYFYTVIKFKDLKEVGIDDNYIDSPQVYYCWYLSTCQKCMSLKNYNCNCSYKFNIKSSKVEIVVSPKTRSNLNTLKPFKFLELEQTYKTLEISEKIECYYCKQNSDKNLNNGIGYGTYNSCGYNFTTPPKVVEGIKTEVYRYWFSYYDDNEDVYRYHDPNCGMCLKTKREVCGTYVDTMPHYTTS
jgi:hypothetical protein